ncbi:hypothetical protein [Mucilaginibacter sp. FT3.2]|uniref:hypothetical protein n=1 Tax=Mucilaginibacter sp. FT3.2 TaxID=2723090 RepID=UPI00161E4F22|nr:hypothetical protein [Mucilaginibacter sp. FT3.2]MBB6234754.1 hypothetical protein [Mucilaginibacter sp. FT3.2]
MDQQIDVTLTGTDSTIEGAAYPIAYGDKANAYEFKSIDGTLHLIIARDADGEWVRLAGTEPYLSSWIDELAEQIA